MPRLAESSIKAGLRSAPVVVLGGARASGKTTTARRLAASEVLLPRDLPLLAVDAATYLAGLTSPVLIDEWQLAGVDLLWTIKQIVDEDPQPGRFILTGSVEPATYGPTYPLTGRAVGVQLRPMTRGELLGAGAQPTFLARIIADPTSPQQRGAGFDAAWLAESGFPAALRSADPRLLLDAYAATVAQRAGDEGRDATRLTRTLRVLATLEAQAVPNQRVWEASDINKLTWKCYDDLLQRVHVSVPLPAYDSNRLNRLTSYPKRFLADTALSLTLAQLDVEGLRADPPLLGRYFEAFVVQQLRPQVDAVGASLSHLRTGAGDREVDVIVEAGDRLLGFEVKLAARPTVDDARQLAWLRDQRPERFAGGYVVHAGADVYPLGDRLWAIPVSIVAGV